MFPSPEERVIGIYNKLLMNKKNTGPSLVFDLDRFEKNVSTIIAATVDKNLRVVMALKACTINKVLNIANRHLDGFEISNLNELALLPGELKNIFVTNPTLTIDQICKISSQCTATQVVFNLDSESQVQLFIDADVPSQVGLRVMIEDKSDDEALSIGTRFGIPYSRLRDAIKMLVQAGHRQIGLHIHHKLKFNEIEQFERTVGGIVAWCSQNNFSPLYIDVGGGLASVGINRF